MTCLGAYGVSEVPTQRQPISGIQSGVRRIRAARAMSFPKKSMLGWQRPEVTIRLETDINMFSLVHTVLQKSPDFI